MIYTFHRKEGFYPLELNSDEEALANAKCNPGTLRVINEITGEIVYANPAQLNDFKFKRK